MQLLYNQKVKHHCKMLVRKHGITFALYGKWLTSLVINDLLETRNKDTNIPREMKKKKKNCRGK